MHSIRRLASTHPPSTSSSSAPADTPTDPDELVLAHLSLARSLALRYRDRGESVDDLVQVACLGLVKAAHGFRPEEGNSFTAYAVPTITGEIRRHFRDHGWDIRPPRRLQELRALLVVAEQELQQELDAAPSDDALAERLGTTVAELREVRRASAAYSAMSIDTPVGADGDATVGDSLADEGDAIGGVIDGAAVRPLLAALAPRDQRLLALRFYGDATQQQIADELGVTQMQVSRLLSSCLGRLRTQLAA